MKRKKTKIKFIKSDPDRKAITGLRRQESNPLWFFGQPVTDEDIRNYQKGLETFKTSSEFFNNEGAKKYSTELYRLKTFKEKYYEETPDCSTNVEIFLVGFYLYHRELWGDPAFELHGFAYLLKEFFGKQIVKEYANLTDRTAMYLPLGFISGLKIKDELFQKIYRNEELIIQSSADYSDRSYIQFVLLGRDIMVTTRDRLFEYPIYD